VLHEFVRRRSAPKAPRVVGTQVVDTEETLYNALQLLYDLLENFGPVWYQKRHHDQARIALSLSARRKAILASESHTAVRHKTLRRAA
jgi:hypothetical protein